MNEENYRLLYTDETGEVVGVDEVQLMDDLEERQRRVLPLRNLLENGDIGEQFESLLILTAWGDEVAIERVGQFLAGNSNPYDGVNTHRLHGADRTYDLLSDALGVGSVEEGVDQRTLIIYAQKLLEMGSDVFFGNGLENLLRKLAVRELLEPTQALTNELTASGRWREASDLLPAIAAMDKQAGWETLSLFGRGADYIDKTEHSAIRALGILQTPEAIEELKRIEKADESLKTFVGWALENRR